MDWIDAHVHVGEDEGGVSASKSDVLALLTEEELAGAVVFCFNETQGIQHGNELVTEVIAEDERLRGLFRVDPAIHEPEDLKAAAVERFAGFKLHPRSQDFGMQAVYEHLEIIGELGKPVLVHTGVGDSVKRRAHPEAVLEAAMLHQDTDIIMAHNTKGYYFHAPDRFTEQVAALDNVYIDISLHCTPLGIETMVDELGSRKLLFASDYPYGHPGPMKANLEYAVISEQDMENIAYRNAERLFF